MAHNPSIEGGELTDIDHLVATPGGLVVVESKFSDLLPDEFSEARRRLAKNIKAVRAWAPPGTPVRGAIVYMRLGHGEREHPMLGEDIRDDESRRFARGFRADLADEAVPLHVRKARDTMLSG